MSGHHVEAANPLYGLMAEFETPGELVAAARRTREAGFQKVRRLLALSDS